MSLLGRVRIPPIVGLAAYLALVAAPLLVLFVHTAWKGTAAELPAGIPTAAPPRAAAPPGSGRSGLPPFDAFGAAEAPDFPDLQLHAVADDAPRPLSALRAGATIVHLWSLACETCADEWPALAAFAAAAGSAKSDFPPVLTVLVVQDAEPGKPAPAARAALQAVRRDGWFGRPAADLAAEWAIAEEDVLAGGGAPTPERPITGYPETFVLDADGRTRLRLVGPVAWDDATWRHLLQMMPDLE